MNGVLKLFNESGDNLLPFDGEVFYDPNFLSHQESALLFDRLRDEVTWKHEPIKLFGKEVLQPRLTAIYGDPQQNYSYSGITMKPNPWDPLLIEIKTKIEKSVAWEFTHVLLNYYRGGKDSMGWHRDNERSLGQNPCIASLSLGGIREFQMRHIKDKSNKLKIPLQSGSLLIMKGESQHYWEHQIPKTSKPVKGRINLTFRKLI